MDTSGFHACVASESLARYVIHECKWSAEHTLCVNVVTNVVRQGRECTAE